MPVIISDAVDSLDDSIMGNTVFEELRDISPNLMKSIYLLSFEKYEGFNTLEMLGE
ncbi:hypothetical protein [Bathymodiolus platifrons methanotrophic gill symbiont]|uniref:hypothetical protein n=1 Tax=Bathymodiolus platifrons methanotrophic gill symbiont TaxID=113268 RepID=UPI001C8E03AB|nr:hypothetical protein [Bathymodiolus platifrons methanotrophic gill symbiont]